MRHLILLVSALPCLLLAACPRTPEEPRTTPDASEAASPLDYDASTPEAVCSNLKTLGCKEGAAANCAETIRRAQGRITDLNLDCLLEAGTKTAARGCKSVDCP